MTAVHVILLCLIPPAYVLGSVPFGLLVAKSRGIDPRKSGSGNIGATNVGRLLGGKFFAIVFTLDLLKSLIPMIAASLVLRAYAGDARFYHPADYLLWLLGGFAALFGHMYSLFLRFKGGKGVATSTGVILGLYPYYTFPAALAILVFLAVFKLTRYVSVSSMIGASSFVFGYLGIGLAARWPVFGAQWPLLAFAVLMAALIIYKHRANLARLRAGTEHRFGASHQPSPTIQAQPHETNDLAHPSDSDRDRDRDCRVDSAPAARIDSMEN